MAALPIPSFPACVQRFMNFVCRTPIPHQAVSRNTHSPSGIPLNTIDKRWLVIHDDSLDGCCTAAIIALRAAQNKAVCEFVKINPVHVNEPESVAAIKKAIAIPGFIHVVGLDIPKEVLYTEHSRYCYALVNYGSRNELRSSSVDAWRVYFGEGRPPRIVLFVSDEIHGGKKYSGTKDVCGYLRAKHSDFSLIKWNDLIKDQEEANAFYRFVTNDITKLNDGITWTS